MISGKIEVNLFTLIRLILEEKLADDLLQIALIYTHSQLPNFKLCEYHLQHVQQVFAFSAYAHHLYIIIPVFLLNITQGNLLLIPPLLGTNKL